jgi:nucleotide-binding universal stress UspA family protein
VANIMIASDGDRASVQAARAVSSLFDTTHSFTILTVVGNVSTAFLEDATIDEHHRAIEEEACRGMEATVDALGKPAEIRVAHGNPAQLIVDAAKITGSDLLVLGTNRGSHLGHFFHRSVSKYVVDHASCPVLVVPMVDGHH